MGGLGSVAELGGLYILLAAGTNLLPEKLRIKRYKFWMICVLLVWWIVLFLGMATYAVGTSPCDEGLIQLFQGQPSD